MLFRTLCGNAGLLHASAGDVVQRRQAAGCDPELGLPGLACAEQLRRRFTAFTFQPEIDERADVEDVMFSGR
ncbi:hypothetical protein A6K26_000050 [Gammaproteobacteria bacterium 2W06]|nr:hypothetical protein A6K26_000050 [Gammaproteobacteria bacterium 2W06]